MATNYDNDDLACMTPQYVSYFLKDDDERINLPIGSVDRNMVFFVAHVVFFMFNFLNTLYIVLIEGYVLKGFKKNLQLQLALCAAIFQMASCYSSIKRYNINEEYKIWGKIGTATGLVAFAFMGSACLRMVALCLLFPKNETFGKKVWVSASVAWALVGAVVFVYSMANWEEVLFTIFRLFVAASNIMLTVSLGVMVVSLRGGNTLMCEGMDNDVLKRLFAVLLCLSLVMLALPKLLGAPIFQFPPTGFNMSLLVIASKYAGTMTTTARGTAGESQSLNA